MRLSVIIVSFNVRYFLEQCLSSVRDAISGQLEGRVEVFVVDNASSDDSIHFLRPLFPGFHFIASDGNSGFARANNLALRQTSGEHIVFLNPDTIVPEDIFQRVLTFMDAHPGTGAAGVRMIDGRGRFLPESKRGFPGAAASFYKMSGLARLFPRSRTFAGYYAGHLSADLVHETEILSGAAMFVRKTVIDTVGSFDERFFMYAEDIDLSWRIRQAGFKNYYLADITIIHFKGESTRRNRQYVRQFYKAMHQFRDKYGKNAGAGEWLLRAGISAKELLSLLSVGWHAIRRRPERWVTGTLNRKTADNELKDPAEKKAAPKYLLLGEPADIKNLRRALTRAGMEELDQDRPQAALVFCQGNTLSWKNIIASIAGETPDRSFYLHGFNTHSLVSGVVGNRPGNVIFLNG